MNISVYSFTPSLSVRAVLRDGEPWFVAADVCAALGHTNTSKAVEDHVHTEDKANHSLGLPGSAPTVVNESGLYALIFGSRKEKAQRFKRWVTSEVLPSIRKTGAYSNPNTVPQAVPASVEALMVAEVAARMLRLEGSAALGMARKATELTAPHLLPMLPVYAIDAPNGSASDIGSEPTASLSALLQEHSAGLSAASANKRLESLGYLEQMQRPSIRGGVKKYWSVTKTGAKYGKNATSDRNQRETQPVWYKATAAAMIQEIKSA